MVLAHYTIRIRIVILSLSLSLTHPLTPYLSVNIQFIHTIRRDAMVLLPAPLWCRYFRFCAMPFSLSIVVHVVAFVFVFVAGAFFRCRLHSFRWDNQNVPMFNGKTIKFIVWMVRLQTFVCLLGICLKIKVFYSAPHGWAHIICGSAVNEMHTCKCKLRVAKNPL